MDSIQKIAISHLADLFSTQKLIFAKRDFWKRIFYNSGQSELYENYKLKLTEKYRQENWVENWSFNDRTFTALLEIFNELHDNQNNEFIGLLKIIVNEINVSRIFVDNVEKKIKITYSSYSNIEEIISEKSNNEIVTLLEKYSNEIFKELKNNLNILYLDIILSSNLNFEILPLTNMQVSVEIQSALQCWLKSNYPNIYERYFDAVRAYGNSDPVGCLSHCRSIITGIFSYRKDEQKKWYSGLKSACKDDKNIENITSPNNISSWNNGVSNNPVLDRRYNYPRFKTITQVYSFLSDLGPHIDEGNIVNGIVDIEIAKTHDALWGLRMVESILVWLYQSQKNDL